MRFLVLIAAALMLAACTPKPAPPVAAPDLPPPRAGIVTDRFALLALACVQQEYPNKIAHVMTTAADARAPSQLYPAFYGCFDWHSAVHGHWLLVRLLNTDPDTPFRPAILAALNKNLTAENIAAELSYFQAPERAGFERPYGTAWFLQLMTELRQAEFPEAAGYAEALAPLEAHIRDNTIDWLGKLAYPIRIGTHNQSAFAFGLMLDWADETGDTAFRKALEDKTRAFHLNDVNCPLSYEPSGEDFLSPCLMEADLMRRVLTPDEFSGWLTKFLPDIPVDGRADWLAPGIVLDPSDGKLVHLDGVNLSRAWALEGIASALPAADARIASLQAAAKVHKDTGVAAVSAEHYAGSHWLASFATYLETKRGIRAP